MRNLIEAMGAGLLSRAQFRGAIACDVLKDTAKRAKAAPTRLKSDLDDGHLGVAQHGLGPFDAARQQVTMRRHAEGVLERAGEMRLRDAADIGQPLDRPFLMRSRVHAILGAEQAAQQGGILANASVRGHATDQGSPAPAVKRSRFDWPN
ncbi:MAG: hypothetical protein M0D54_06520 [Hyphomonadaceae bacterium JAD_PAG50586_4]|nr:MAG: hypothetical protein M0D54_06520 [Hyphomonadaceae bacterium JAD_PAG50586_4]